MRLTRATHFAMPETGQAAKMSADCRLAEEHQICVSVQQMVGAQRVNQRPLVPDLCQTIHLLTALMCGEAAVLEVTWSSSQAATRHGRCIAFDVSHFLMYLDVSDVSGPDTSRYISPIQRIVSVA